MVERVDASPQGLVGAWEPTTGHGHAEFRFKGYRYLIGLTSTPPTTPVQETFAFTTRARGTCYLTSNDTFTGTVTVDRLDANENPLPIAAQQLGLEGTRFSPP
jgi:hypothetical protein